MEEKGKLIKKIGAQINEVKECLNQLQSMEEDNINKGWLVGTKMELERSEHCFEMYVRDINF